MDRLGVATLPSFIDLTMKTLEHIWNEFSEKEHFLLSTHLLPDADAVSSELALAALLRWSGKRCQIINESSLPEVIRFLPGIEKIQTYEGQSLDHFDFLVALDCGGRYRMGDFVGSVSYERLVNIDHHISNDRFGDLNWVEPGACSTAEMILELVDLVGMPIDSDLATCLYTGILTDTVNFCSSSTTPRTHEIAARLVGLGARPEAVSRELYRSWSLGKFNLQAMVIETLHISDGGRIAWARLTQEMCERSGVGSTDALDLVTLPISIDGVEVGVLFRELDGGLATKVSFRGEGTVDMSRLAIDFGGGGHPAASGCTLQMGVEQAVETVVPHVIERVESVQSPIRLH
ncbi:MAG: bifunctional oligoribonuclease/PAP phosphatase NrnA [Planctomycetota bacterium]|jgi:phosphoesterase RecJ-like protein|nr:bifunctional oligoribonuclease/PAP phosphatase NrnA [Planctomycetota bacterium]